MYVSQNLDVLLIYFQCRVRGLERVPNRRRDRDAPDEEGPLLALCAAGRHLLPRRQR